MYTYVCMSIVMLVILSYAHPYVVIVIRLSNIGADLFLD